MSHHSIKKLNSTGSVVVTENLPLSTSFKSLTLTSEEEEKNSKEIKSIIDPIYEDFTEKDKKGILKLDTLMKDGNYLKNVKHHPILSKFIPLEILFRILTNDKNSEGKIEEIERTNIKNDILMFKKIHALLKRKFFLFYSTFDDEKINKYKEIFKRYTRKHKQHILDLLYANLIQFEEEDSIGDLSVVNPLDERIDLKYIPEIDDLSVATHKNISAILDDKSIPKWEICKSNSKKCLESCTINSPCTLKCEQTTRRCFSKIINDIRKAQRIEKKSNSSFSRKAKQRRKSKLVKIVKLKNGKYKAVFKLKNGKTKIIKFEKKKIKKVSKNPMTKSALIKWILFNKSTLKASIKDYKRKFY